jgi:hypothetical protein
MPQPSMASDCLETSAMLIPRPLANHSKQIIMIHTWAICIRSTYPCAQPQTLRIWDEFRDDDRLYDRHVTLRPELARTAIKRASHIFDGMRRRPAKPTLHEWRHLWPEWRDIVVRNSEHSAHEVG